MYKSKLLCIHEFFLSYPTYQIIQESLRAGHSQFLYAVNTILRRVALTSENLQN